MRVVGWNVQQGGGPPVERIVAALVSLDADVLVVGEHRASGPLSEMLVQHGWVHQFGLPDPKGGFAAVLMASRRRLAPVTPHYSGQGYAQRWVHAEVVGTEWAVAGALLPGHHREFHLQKMQFWDFVVSEFAPAAADRPTLLVGDLNTGLHRIDEVGATLRCSEDMAALRAAGWVDVWHDLRPGERPPPTWWEPATGNGFRLDHAFLSPCSPAALSIDYPSEIDGAPTTRAGARKAIHERPPLSDHVPIVIDLDFGTRERLRHPVTLCEEWA